MPGESSKIEEKEGQPPQALPATFRLLRPLHTVHGLGSQIYFAQMVSRVSFLFLIPAMFYKKRTKKTPRWTFLPSNENKL